MAPIGDTALVEIITLGSLGVTGLAAGIAAIVLGWNMAKKLSHYFVLVCLTLADCLTCGVSVTLTLAALVQEEEGKHQLCSHVAVAFFIQGCSNLAAVFLLLLAIERFLFVRFQNHYRVFCQRQRCWILGSALITAIITVPSVILEPRQVVHQCSVSGWKRYEDWSILLLCVTALVLLLTGMRHFREQYIRERRADHFPVEAQMVINSEGYKRSRSVGFTLAIQIIILSLTKVFLYVGLAVGLPRLCHVSLIFRFLPNAVRQFILCASNRKYRDLALRPCMKYRSTVSVEVVAPEPSHPAGSLQRISQFDARDGAIISCSLDLSVGITPGNDEITVQPENTAHAERVSKSSSSSSLPCRYTLPQNDSVSSASLPRSLSKHPSECSSVQSDIPTINNTLVNDLYTLQETDSQVSELRSWENSRRNSLPPSIEQLQVPHEENERRKSFGDFPADSSDAASGDTARPRKARSESFGVTLTATWTLSASPIRHRSASCGEMKSSEPDSDETVPSLISQEITDHEFQRVVQSSAKKRALLESDVPFLLPGAVPSPININCKWPRQRPIDPYRPPSFLVERGTCDPNLRKDHADAETETDFNTCVSGTRKTSLQVYPCSFPRGAKVHNRKSLNRDGGMSMDSVLDTWDSVGDKKSQPKKSRISDASSIGHGESESRKTSVCTSVRLCVSPVGPLLAFDSRETQEPQAKRNTGNTQHSYPGNRQVTDVYDPQTGIYLGTAKQVVHHTPRKSVPEKY